jgi:hypothetical protein
MNYPSAIIFVNSNISDQVKEVIQRQLFITNTIDFDNFDGYEEGRVLVLVSDFLNVEKRELADVVIYVKMGLAYILKNNLGPTGLTVQVDRMYIQKLLLENGKL